MNRKMKVCTYTIPIMVRGVDYGAPNQWTFIAFKSLKSGCCWLQSTVQGHRSLIYDTRKKWHFHVFKFKTLLGTPFLGSMITVTLINPLSPNSDQQQFSPNNIHTMSRDKVMRINKMITIEKMLWSFIKFSQLIVKGDVWRSVWRICIWILGLKGLMHDIVDF